MSSPVVIIHTNASATLADYYEAIKASLDARYHAPGNSFPDFHVSEQELAEQAALSSYAAHAGDGLHIGSTHIERLIS